VDDMDDLIAGVRYLLSDDGGFIFETQYGLDVIRNNLLDTVYHEHLSYFTVRPLASYFGRMGMQVVDVTPIASKGGSMRMTVQKGGGGRPIESSVGEFLSLEERVGIYGRDVYANLLERIARIRAELHRAIDLACTRRRPIVGYGVSVGTTTLLAQFALQDRIDVMIDDDPNKEKYLRGPGYDLPVVLPPPVMERDPALFVMFAWRYVDPILLKHQVWFKRGGHVAVPLPDLRILESVSGRFS
jgi:hypothetical protein